MMYIIFNKYFENCLAMPYLIREMGGEYGKQQPSLGMELPAKKEDDFQPNLIEPKKLNKFYISCHLLREVSHLAALNKLPSFYKMHGNWNFDISIEKLLHSETATKMV